MSKLPGEAHTEPYDRPVVDLRCLACGGLLEHIICEICMCEGYHNYPRNTDPCLDCATHGWWYTCERCRTHWETAMGSPDEETLVWYVIDFDASYVQRCLPLEGSADAHVP